MNKAKGKIKKKKHGIRQKKNNKTMNKAKGNIKKYTNRANEK